MSFLIDTNVLSELRKRERCSRAVWIWYEGTPVEKLFLSVLVLGKIRRGVEIRLLKDPSSGLVFEKWLDEVKIFYAARILPVTVEICDVWGRLSLHAPLPHVDGLLAATAIVHDLTLVTRNIADVKRSGARCLDPFIPQT